MLFLSGPAALSLDPYKDNLRAHYRILKRNRLTLCGHYPDFAIVNIIAWKWAQKERRKLANAKLRHSPVDGPAKLSLNARICIKTWKCMLNCFHFSFTNTNLCELFTYLGYAKHFGPQLNFIPFFAAFLFICLFLQKAAFLCVLHYKLDRKINTECQIAVL